MACRHIQSICMSVRNHQEASTPESPLPVSATVQPRAPTTPSSTSAAPQSTSTTPSSFLNSTPNPFKNFNFSNEISNFSAGSDFKIAGLLIFGGFYLKTYFKYRSLLHAIKLRYRRPAHQCFQFNGRCFDDNPNPNPQTQTTIQTPTPGKTQTQTRTPTSSPTSKAVTGEILIQHLRVRDYFKNVSQQTTFIHYGPSGRGKSFCSQLLAEHLSQQDYPCIIVSRYQSNKIDQQQSTAIKELKKKINKQFGVPRYINLLGLAQYMSFEQHLYQVSTNLKRLAGSRITRIALGLALLAPNLILLPSAFLPFPFLLASATILPPYNYWVSPLLKWMFRPKPLMVIFDDVAHFVKQDRLVNILNAFVNVQDKQECGIRVIYFSSQKLAVATFIRSAYIWNKLARLIKFHPGELFRKDFWATDTTTAALEFQSQFGFPPKETQGQEWMPKLKLLLEKCDFDYRNVVSQISKGPKSVQGLEKQLRAFYRDRIKDLTKDIPIAEMKAALDQKNLGKLDNKMLSLLLRLDYLQEESSNRQRYRKANTMAGEELRGWVSRKIGNSQKDTHK